MTAENLFTMTPSRANSGVSEYEFPADRQERDFSGPASTMMGELFARVQDFLTKPELTMYSQHAVNPPFILMPGCPDLSDFIRAYRP